LVDGRAVYGISVVEPKRGPNGEPVPVEVRIEARLHDAILVLMTGDPVHWRFRAIRPGQIAAVASLGHPDQRVSGLLPATAAAARPHFISGEARPKDEIAVQPVVSPGTFLGACGDSNDQVCAIRALFGVDPAKVYVVDETSKIRIR